MKTQRRHELQTNQLADWLGKQIERIRPYSTTIIAVIIGLIAIAGTYMYLNRVQRGEAQVAWNAFYLAINSQDAEQLRDVAVTFRDSDPGRWAQLAAADIDLATGITGLFRDRELATRSLEQAKKDYQAVIDIATAGTDLYYKAQFGLAQANESLGELEAASELYEELAERESAVGLAAKQRLEALKKNATRELYEALATHAPERQDDLQTPGGLLDLDSPLNFDDLSDRPDFGLSEQPLAPATPASPEATVTEEATTPAESEEAPTQDAPTAETPSEAPAESETPAEAPDLNPPLSLEGPENTPAAEQDATP